MPSSSEAYSNLGVALTRQGKTAEAIAAFSEAVLLNPADATSRGRLEYLKRGGARGTSPP